MRKLRKKKESEGVKLLRYILQGIKIYLQIKEAVDKYNQEQLLIQQINQLSERITIQTNRIMVDLYSIKTRVVEKKKRIVRRRFKLVPKINGIKPAPNLT